MSITSHAEMYGVQYRSPYTPDMAKRRIMGAQDARAAFSDRLDAAEKQGEHTVVLRRSRPSGILVPPEWYHRASAALGDPWDDWLPPSSE